MRGWGGLPPRIPAILICEARAGLEQVCLSVIPKLNLKGSLVIQNRHNTITSGLFRSNMKEIDDTPLPENESEDPGPTTRRMMVVLHDQITETRELDILPLERLTRQLVERIEGLELRIANLETQRTPQDENDDPEWY